MINITNKIKRPPFAASLVILKIKTITCLLAWSISACPSFSIIRLQTVLCNHKKSKISNIWIWKKYIPRSLINFLIKLLTFPLAVPPLTPIKNGFFDSPLMWFIVLKDPKLENTLWEIIFSLLLLRKYWNRFFSRILTMKNIHVSYNISISWCTSTQPTKMYNRLWQLTVRNRVEILRKYFIFDFLSKISNWFPLVIMDSLGEVGQKMRVSPWTD